MTFDPQSFNINFASGEFKQKRSYAVYAELREKYPAYPIQMPTGFKAWVFTRYDDCVKLLKDKRLFANPASVPELGMTYADVVQDELLAEILFNSLVSFDPPDHTRIRSIAHKAFTPKMVASLEGSIQQIADSLTDQLVGAGKVDFIEQFAYPLPMIVICEMLGIPKEDHKLFSDWTKTWFQNQNNPENYPIVREMVIEFVAYMKEIFGARRKNPKNDLISNLIEAAETEGKMTENELYSLVFTLMIAGHETTVNLISNGTWLLLEQADQFDKLKKQPELVPTAVEEFLRYRSSVEVNLDRYVGEDFEMHGQQIRTGEMIITVLASANRDEKQFPYADQLDITRKPNRHIAFGNGIHFCLGAPLARLEGKIAFSTLIDRFPHIQLAVDPNELMLNDTYLMRELKELPVTV